MSVVRERGADGDRSGDARATAVLSVLAGIPASTVAARCDVTEAELTGWVEDFVMAGRRGLGAGASDRSPDRSLPLVAHELRSPLTMIRGWAELLDGDAADTRLIAQARAGILAQVARLSRLAEDTLDASGVAMGRVDMELTTVRLGDLVGGIVAARSLDRPEVVVHDDLLVRVDVDRMGQVVDNLLENVRKHAGTTARVEVRRRADRGEVVVSSTGPAIAPDVARRLFEPYERGATDAKGSGLGLYVCRALVTAHDGEIGLRVDAVGNHFWVSLPLVDGGSAAPGAEVASAADVAGGAQSRPGRSPVTT